MALHDTSPQSVAEYLSEQTGKPESEFEPPDDLEYPHPETMEWEEIDD